MMSNYYYMTNGDSINNATASDEYADQVSPRSTNTDVYATMSHLTKVPEDRSVQDAANEKGGSPIAPMVDRDPSSHSVSRNDNYEINDMDEEESPAEVAMLLTSFSDIVAKEIKADPPVMNALASAFPRFPDLSHDIPDAERAAEQSGTSASMDYELELPPPAPTTRPYMEHYRTLQGPTTVGSSRRHHSPTLLHFDHKESKTRSVSIDDAQSRHRHGIQTEDESIPTFLEWKRSRSNSEGGCAGIFSTPPPSPRVPKNCGSAKRGEYIEPNSEYRRSNCMTIEEGVKMNRPRAVSLAEGGKSQGNRHDPQHSMPPLPSLEVCKKKSVHAKSGGHTGPKKLILRKKFSWKNYPELEEFLIANREEYLRHSTLNYTMQQKKYNNCLTERMIQLAAQNGYEFDESEFSFVTVRDRIRCYFKSYVQSMKKRGVVIGYAARKAGLVTEEELEQSAHTSGKIYVPRG
mmetsp:Transcript_6348/g.14056  ORF Transcript_6348/g.14056 Transcript_6348/m.14056 type:complete len:462 (-) Transcript_6348:474-1859(-)